MDKTERKARELMRVRENRICDTCLHFSENKCSHLPDKNSCVYNDYEQWKPSLDKFFGFAERVLNGGG